MMVRETLGVQTFDEVTDPEMQRLIGEGSTEELLAWLEQARRAANQPSVFLIR